MNGLYSNSTASTSSHPYGTQYSVTHQIPMPHQAHHQNDWNPPMTQQQINRSPPLPNQLWTDQPNQKLLGGMAAMAGFNMAYVPPQVLQDAMALSAPVDATDEPTLVEEILSGLKRRANYKDILNGLHGKNGHSASLWKDYYLEHKSRLDGWVNMCLEKRSGSSTSATTPTEASRPSIPKSAPVHKHPAPTIKKPSPSSFKPDSSPRVAYVAPNFAKKRKAPSPKPPPVQTLAQAAGSRRSTINSLTVGEPVYDRRLPAPHSQIKIPEPPSREPSPPTEVVLKGRGYKYTDQDHDFFIKFIQWHLKLNPYHTRNELCEMVAEKAPHHTAASWASYWSIHHDLPDKIMAAAREESYADEYEKQPKASASSPASSSRKRPRYLDPTSSEEEASSDEEPKRVRKRKSYKEESNNSDSDSDSDSDDGTPIRRYKESEMGVQGGSFTEADMYIAAKYICDFRNWDGTAHRNRWEPFAEKHPQRSTKSWCEYYRRYETEIDQLVRKLRREKAKQSTANLKLRK
ncbi:hypothetical protein FA15DRAFT_751795 [Coprinopsis marcescibilis]|uniref:Uncharacterized protein n=1 Tax=Coprinopsis marcescibilis TaxID=230819 RepID=A0A5C3LD98_COPMA|nr:hypothetical protein FA15DRAFT_751795 [Coprinopsis marcescibilis]